MSADTQLGLFSGLGTSEATSSSDVATTTPDYRRAAAANPAAVSERAPISQPVSTESAHPRRKSKAAWDGQAHAEERYLSVQDVARRYAISIQTVWRHTKQNPAFPKPIKILNGTTRWKMSDILSFELARQEADQ
ncbi:MAG: helix-turn-helix transcriptional regulator [Agrobacterium tumefaciens]